MGTTWLIPVIAYYLTDTAVLGYPVFVVLEEIRLKMKVLDESHLDIQFQKIERTFNNIVFGFSEAKAYIRVFNVF